MGRLPRAGGVRAHQGPDGEAGAGRCRAHRGPLPDPALHRVRRWWLPGAFPPLQAQPLDDPHERGLRNERTGADDLYRRRQLADLHGAPEKIGRLWLELDDLTMMAP